MKILMPVECVLNYNVAVRVKAGVKDNKITDLINKNKDVPIFQIADGGIVSDLFEVFSELEREPKTVELREK
jgi:electron transfer flavoprotein alpha subunit